MYLVPLNTDYFFKKVFSSKWIAKQFFEDFLNVTIEEIELLQTTHKLTDKSTIIKFDFRCKIDEEYAIIEMQQGYHTDVVKRFYTYHSVSNALQLEYIQAERKAEEARLFEKTNQKKRITDEYKYIVPVKTIVWMVNDTLGFKDDFVKFKMLPAECLDLLQNQKLWETSNITELRKQRDIALGKAENEKKNLPFIQKNELIFAFQKNIVKNKKLEKYVRWFQFAERTRDKRNQPSDFINYQNDYVFEEIINRLNRNIMEDIELNLEEELQKMQDIYQTFEDEKERVVQEMLQEMQQEKEKAAREKEQISQEKEQISQEKDKLFQQLEKIEREVEEEKKASGQLC